ncbi:MAG: tyrosine-type recombinase/integrase [Devosia sp.]
MRQKLTKKVVETVLPGTKDQLFWDSEVPGFGLKVTPSGKRTYFAYYRTPSGQQRKPKIGEHGVLTVDDARQIARQWLAMANAGHDVSQERKASRSALTVEDLAERYLSEYAVPNKKASSVASDRANLQNHVVPTLGTMRVKDVRRADIELLKLAVREGKTARTSSAKARGRRIVTGGQGVANRVLALASKMFGCAEEWGLIETNPARGIRKYREFRKDRYLDRGEVSRLLVALDEVDGAGKLPVAATAAIRILLFTGMRSGEVLELQWSQIDKDKSCFRLAETKTGARIIPYGREVEEQLNRVSQSGIDSAYVFAGSGGRPVALRRPWYTVRDMAAIDRSATLHTLRHTFASWSVMGGLSLAQVGSLLGHKSPQTTLRYADHAMEEVRGYAALTNTVLASLRQ